MKWQKLNLNWLSVQVKIILITQFQNRIEESLARLLEADTIGIGKDLWQITVNLLLFVVQLPIIYRMKRKPIPMLCMAGNLFPRNVLCIGKDIALVNVPGQRLVIIVVCVFMFYVLCQSLSLLVASEIILFFFMSYGFLLSLDNSLSPCSWKWNWNSLRAVLFIYSFHRFTLLRGCQFVSCVC